MSNKPEVVAYLKYWRNGNEQGIHTGLTQTDIEGFRNHKGPNAEMVSDEPLIRLADYEADMAAAQKLAETNRAHIELLYQRQNEWLALLMDVSSRIHTLHRSRDGVEGLQYAAGKIDAILAKHKKDQC